ncbi:MAG: hypothetical protein F7C34_03340 [Desulfurococcales archaeon]|nr:hypothetical protein [Desulfurococcales archaeon]
MLDRICSWIPSHLEGRRGTLIYHWDADGAASAALALRALEAPWRLEIPRIGLYSSAALPVEVEGKVLVLDYGIPGREYDSYASLVGADRLGVADHHKVEPPSSVEKYCNPVAAGLGGEDEYPACSLLVGRILFKDPGPIERQLMALGIIGDLAPFLDSNRPHPAIEIARRLVEGTGYTLLDLREAVDLVDSSYRVLDYNCLRSAARILAEEGLEGLYSLGCARSNREKAERIVEGALSRLERAYSGPLLDVYTLVYDAYVTSAIGRRLASSAPQKIVALVHTMPQSGVTFAYIRSVSRDLAPVRRALEESGYRVGGKSHVIVVEASPSDAQELVARLVDIISRRLGGSAGRSA